MPYVPPWIRSTDTLGAISSGASVGLQVRRQAESEQRAADQLRLAQDELFERRQRAQEEIAERRNESAARLAQASAMMALQSGRYDDAKKFQESSLALRERREDFLQSKFEANQESMEDETSISALPITDEQGNVLGRGVRGRGGSFHMIKPEPVGPLKATPSSTSALIRGIDGELKGEEEISPERRAALGEQRRRAVDFLQSNVLGAPPRMVPQVTTNAATKLGGWMGIGTPERTTTNHVPESATSALETTATPVPPRPNTDPREVKLEIGRKILQAHPDWDKPRVLAEVERILSGR